MTDDLDPSPGAEAAATAAPGDAQLPAADTQLPSADAQLPAGDASLLALVDRLAGLLERSDLLELEVEAGATAINLRKPAALAAAPALPAPAGPGPADGAAPRAAGPGPAVDPGATSPAEDPATAARAAVLAPLTGIFYASPTPGSPPFVAVGQEVVAGQVIGLIEAMKLFNEIKSDKAGRVVRVVPANGTLVKAKQPLIEVEPL
jgi:acetyl-CoA carboxylase biotin carboxyl carrier protein